MQGAEEGPAEVVVSIPGKHPAECRVALMLLLHHVEERGARFDGVSDGDRNAIVDGLISHGEAKVRLWLPGGEPRRAHRGIVGNIADSRYQRVRWRFGLIYRQ